MSSCPCVLVRNFVVVGLLLAVPVLAVTFLGSWKLGQVTASDDAASLTSHDVIGLTLAQRDLSATAPREAAVATEDSSEVATVVDGWDYTRRRPRNPTNQE